MAVGSRLLGLEWGLVTARLANFSILGTEQLTKLQETVRQPVNKDRRPFACDQLLQDSDYPPSKALACCFGIHTEPLPPPNTGAFAKNNKLFREAAVLALGAIHPLPPSLTLPFIECEIVRPQAQLHTRTSIKFWPRPSPLRRVEPCLHHHDIQTHENIPTSLRVTTHFFVNKYSIYFLKAMLHASPNCHT